MATTTPRIVPPIASKANFRVPTASKRRIDSTPSSTQKPCVTPVMLTTRTAIPRPSALRRELRSHGDSQCICDATIDRRGRMGMGGRRSRDSTVPPFARRASSAICSTSRPDMRMRWSAPRRVAMVAVSVPRAASARTQRSIAAVICTRQSSIGRPDGRCCVSVMAAARSSSVAMIAPTRSLPGLQRESVRVDRGVVGLAEQEAGAVQVVHQQGHGPVARRQAADAERLAAVGVVQPLDSSGELCEAVPRVVVPWRCMPRSLSGPGGRGEGRGEGAAQVGTAVVR